MGFSIVRSAINAMGKRSTLKQRERRRHQKRKRLKKTLLKESSHVLVTPENSINAEDSTAYRDDLDSEIPNLCSGETYLTYHCARSLRGLDNIDSPLPSMSSLSSLPLSPVMAATAPFQNEMPIVIVDKKRKFEVHISDPEYERLPGA